MSYSDIIGHERTKRLLLEAVRRDKVHHAWLMVGPSGVGKRLLSQNFARALNCERQDGDACDQCLACRKALSGVHPDLLVVGANKDDVVLKIEEVRAKVLHFMSLKVMEARYRVVVILDAERLNESAANALLKTLEEPPSHTVFILTAVSLSTLLPTIRSRCQKVRLAPLEEGALTRHLMASRGVLESEAALLARLSGGSLGKALDLTKERLEARERLFASLFRPDPALTAQQLTEKLLSGKDARATLLSQLEMLASLLQDVERYRLVSRPCLANPDQEELISSLSSRFPLPVIEGLLRLLLDLRAALNLNLRPAVVLERLVHACERVNARHG